jgi:hypothetical protein
MHSYAYAASWGELDVNENGTGGELREGTAKWAIAQIGALMPRGGHFRRRNLILRLQLLQRASGLSDVSGRAPKWLITSDVANAPNRAAPFMGAAAGIPLNCSSRSRAKRSVVRRLTAAAGRPTLTSMSSTITTAGSEATLIPYHAAY